MHQLPASKASKGSNPIQSESLDAGVEHHRHTIRSLEGTLVPVSVLFLSCFLFFVYECPCFSFEHRRFLFLGLLVCSFFFVVILNMQADTKTTCHEKKRKKSDMDISYRTFCMNKLMPSRVDERLGRFFKDGKPYMYLPGANASSSFAPSLRPGAQGVVEQI